MGIKVYRVCSIHVISFQCFEPRPYLVCHVTTMCCSRKYPYPYHGNFFEIALTKTRSSVLWNILDNILNYPGRFDFIPSSLPDNLFISFRRPHKLVTSTTLGHWLRTFMSAAGIDSKIFKAHSMRGVSTYDSSCQCICPAVNYHFNGRLVFCFNFQNILLISPCLIQTLLLGSYPQSRSTCKLPRLFSC